jgi:hypothetical protein
MKNSITHIKAQRAKRPRESHIKLDVRHVDEVLKGTEALQLQVFQLERDKQELERKLAAK